MFYFMETVTGFTCGGTDVLNVIKFVYTLLKIILFIVPMGLIVMVMIDLSKNVIANKDDEMKKNFGIAIKRIMYCAALFLIEPIVAFFTDFVGENSDNYLKCISIAESDEVWKYKIDWDYYPYELSSTKENSDSDGNYIIYISANEKTKGQEIHIYKDFYTRKDGSKGKIKIYDNGTMIKEK